MVDPVTRAAARTAAFVALPIAVLVGVGSFWLLGGFSGPPDTDGSGPKAPYRVQSSTPVTMPARALTGREAEVCRALVAKLPAALRELSRRPVTAGPEQNAAYGDPAITLACAAGPQPSYPDDDYVFGLDQTCWHQEAGAGNTVLVSVGREVPVTVTVPAGYDAPGQWAIEFSAAIAATVPALPDDKIPYGCKN